MLKTVLLVLAGFVAALGIAFWLQPSPEPSVESEASSGIASAAQARPEAIGETPFRAPRAQENAANRLGSCLPQFIDRTQRAGAATPREQRLAVDLIVAGFAPDRAEWINRRVQELRIQAVQAQCEARREGRPPPADIEAATLRTELGDQDYERYLAATGRPTGINILGVLASSPAERAGLQRRDEIFAYDGQRVFNVQELNELALGGTSGEPVVVDVRRNGENLRIVLPRGPVGVASGGDPRGSPPDG
jgi:PDZ domain-containing protein